MRDVDDSAPDHEALPREDRDQAVQPDPIAEGVRRQRRHIQDLDGDDPLRGGMAD